MSSSLSIRSENSRWEKIREVARQEGVIGLLNRGGRKLRPMLFRTTCSTWFERDLAAPINDFLPGIELEISFLVEDKSRLITWLQQQHATYPWIYFEQEIRSALEHDHIFMVLSHLDSIIGYVKVGVQRVYIHDFRQNIDFPAATAFVYDTFVVPEYRGKRLALLALNRCMQYLQGQGYARLLCHIEKWNVASIRTFEHAGFKEKGEVRYFALAGNSFYVLNGHSPRTNLDRLLTAPDVGCR